MALSTLTMTIRAVEGGVEIDVLGEDGDTYHRVRAENISVAELPTLQGDLGLAGAELRLDLHGVTAGSYTLHAGAVEGRPAGLHVTRLDPALDATVAVTASGVTLTLAAGTGQAVLA